MSSTLADVKAAAATRLKAIGWTDGALLLAVAVFAMVQLGRGETSSAAIGLVTFLYIAEMVVWKTEARKWQARYEEATRPKLTEQQEFAAYKHFGTTDVDLKTVTKAMEAQQKLSALRYDGR